MSHFSKLEIKMKRKDVLRKLASKFGWTQQDNITHVNGWSRETVANATVFFDNYGTAKLVLDAAGTPVVDPYYMGREYEKFLQEYAADLIMDQARSEGAVTNQLGFDKQGNMLLEVCYNA